jgi:threonylcarbamoyladenosine tRNA methylthiotransferase MtaB
MNIYFDVIGCRLNQSEVENLANIFRALGHQVVSEPADADLAIINTCTVTTKAAADSRKKLRRAARLGAKNVIATGCWATLNPEKALDLAGVKTVFTNDEKDFIPVRVLDLSFEEISKLHLVRMPLPGDRGRTRAFIKVQEGCDNHCTYCLTRVARGKSRSTHLGIIKRDINAAVEGGAQEIVLTGVQLGAWGREFSPPMGLRDLLENVLSIEGFKRVRLSSIEPWDFDTELLSLWSDDRLCRHFHIPLQSGDDQTLKMMGRPITTGGFAKLVSAIRSIIPDAAVTTDVITGFPGESDDSFIKTEKFIKSVGFSGGHVFTYSPRPGTAAIKMKDSVPRDIAKQRNAVLRRLFDELGHDFQRGLIGKTLSVLWESSELQPDGYYINAGLTDNYLRVYANSPNEIRNKITPVEMIAHHPKRSALMGKFPSDS